MKLITFAIPCYNSAEYMGKCIDSLLKAGEDAEILIVNDGSTKDNTAEIADKYQSEYPNICKAIHKENGGHGSAVNEGIKNATGKYYKVVDSDDWVDEEALKKVMETIRSFEGKEEVPDAILTNYVYEHTYTNTQRVVHYRKKLPKDRLFNFEESKKFGVGQFLAMHSVIYRTQILKDINLELPKHTFYVDNIFVYTPLPFIEKFYYLDVDLYRYFIGREDQSVNIKNQIKRNDQMLRVAKIMVSKYNVAELKKERPKLCHYMKEYSYIIVVLSSIFLILEGTPEALAKKKELWQYLKENAPYVYKKCKHKFTSITKYNNKFMLGLSKIVYSIARKKLKAN
ncbi:MAG: glycosyltransferase family 2 protein [Clostridiales bacterium]|nr:glycosyltransferase family 2 protein [Clostridiales bacterium]